MCSNVPRALWGAIRDGLNLEGFNRTSKAEGKAVAQAHLDPLQAMKGVVSDIGMHEFLQADLIVNRPRCNG